MSAAERDGTLLIAVTLGCPDDWNAHTAMLDYGFDNFKSVNVLPEGGIDLSPFGLPCEKQKAVWRTLSKNAAPTLTYSVRYENGETEVRVK